MSTFLLASALLLATPAHAEDASSPDGTYVVAVPEKWRVREGLLGPSHDQFQIELMDSQAVAPEGYKEHLATVIKKTEAGGVVASWAGTLANGSAGACADTRGAVGFKVKIQTFCLAELGSGRAALLRMTTRNLVKGGEFSDELHDLLDEVRPTGAAPSHATRELQPDAPPPQPEISQPVLASEWYSANPQTDGQTAVSTDSTNLAMPEQGGAAAAPGATAAGAPEASSGGGPSLAVLGYTCTQGRWNADAVREDLQVWWKPQTRELVAHFTVKDGPETVAFTLGGVVEVGPAGGSSGTHQEFFGHLVLRDGPPSSVSGIHRLFQSVDVQGTVDGGVVSALRTTQDERFTTLRGCGSS